MHISFREYSFPLQYIFNVVSSWIIQFPCFFPPEIVFKYCTVFMIIWKYVVFQRKYTGIDDDKDDNSDDNEYKYSMLLFNKSRPRSQRSLHKQSSNSL